MTSLTSLRQDILDSRRLYRKRVGQAYHLLCTMCDKMRYDARRKDVREVDLCQCTIYYCWECEDSGYVYEEKTADVLREEGVLTLEHIDNTIRRMNGQELLPLTPITVTHAVITKPCTSCYMAWRK